MFDVGFWELVLIGGLALVILGPERLPKVAAELGRWMGRARAMARQLRNQLDEEVGFDQHPRATRGAPPPPRPAQSPTPPAATPPADAAPAAEPASDSAPADTAPKQTDE